MQTAVPAAPMTLSQFLTGKDVDNPDLAFIILANLSPADLGQLTCAATWKMSLDRDVFDSELSLSLSL